MRSFFHFFVRITFFRIFRKNDFRKNVQSRPIFERTIVFFRNEFWKNDRRISKERYSIKWPIPVLFVCGLKSRHIAKSYIETERLNTALNTPDSEHFWTTVTFMESQGRLLYTQFWYHMVTSAVIYCLWLFTIGSKSICILIKQRNYYQSS